MSSVIISTREYNWALDITSLTRDSVRKTTGLIAHIMISSTATAIITAISILTMEAMQMGLPAKCTMERETGLYVAEHGATVMMHGICLKQISV